jgi:flagellar biosynthesis protein FliQ
MTADLALDLGTQMIWTALKLAAPVLFIAMAVGLVISVFQVITQIQEISLTFVPKMVAVAMTIIVLGPWMLSTVVQFSRGLIGNIPNYF